MGVPYPPQIDQLVSLMDNIGGSVTTSTSIYLDPTTESPVYRYSPTTGLTDTVVVSNPLPATARINESGNLDTYSYSDGGSETGTWQLKAATSSYAD